MDWLWYGAMACFALSALCCGIYLWLSHRERQRELTTLEVWRYYAGVPERRRVS